MQPTFRRVGPAGCLIIAAASLMLAACGGGSSSNSTTAAATTTTPGQPGARFAAVRQCLAKSGITLPPRPARPPGTPAAPGTGGGGGIFGGGGAGGGLVQRLPAGVTQAQLQAALAKCGGVAGRRVGPTLTPAQRAAQRAALVKFAACMRQNGINVPAPNTTGRGPVFTTAKLDITSKAFKTAQAKCMSLLPARFGRGQGGPPPGASGPTTGGG